MKKKKITTEKIIIVVLSLILVGLLLQMAFSNDRRYKEEVFDENNYQENDQLQGEHYLGDVNSKVVITEYSSFTCPFCKRFKDDTFDDIKREYIDTGKVLYIYRHYTRNDLDVLASNASECAGEQDKFFEYINLLYKNQTQLQNQEFEKYAQELNLDIGQFNECFSSLRYNSKINKDKEEALKRGITGTPGFTINEEKVSGAQPFLVFKQVIDSLLE